MKFEIFVDTSAVLDTDRVFGTFVVIVAAMGNVSTEGKTVSNVAVIVADVGLTGALYSVKGTPYSLRNRLCDCGSFAFLDTPEGELEFCFRIEPRIAPKDFGFSSCCDIDFVFEYFGSSVDSTIVEMEASVVIPSFGIKRRSLFEPMTFLMSNFDPLTIGPIKYKNSKTSTWERFEFLAGISG